VIYEKEVERVNGLLMSKYIYIFLCGFMVNACLWRLEAGNDVFTQMVILSLIVCLIALKKPTNPR
jgi:hypothetical protein